MNLFKIFENKPVPPPVRKKRTRTAKRLMTPSERKAYMTGYNKAYSKYRTLKNKA